MEMHARNFAVRTFVLLAGLFVALAAGTGLYGCSSAESETSSAAVSEAAEETTTDQAAGDGAAAGASAEATPATGAVGVEEATKLIGEIKTKDELEAILGPSDRFEMSSEGCERGVYAGIFYYDDYTVYSRTYDKGQTFTIVSASE